jgi:hypothetical protein
MSDGRVESTRGLRAIERLWWAADEVARGLGCAPFLVQIVVTGRGRVEPECLRVAASDLVARWPLAGARLSLCGRRLRAAHSSLPVTLVPHAAGRVGDTRFETMPRAPSPKVGPLVDAVVVDGLDGGWIIRAHHTLLDGRATRALAQDWARAARGEPLLGPGPSPAEPSRGRGPGQSSSPRPTVPAVGVGPEPPESTRWRRRSLRAPERDVTCTVLDALCRAIRAEVPALATTPLRVSVPVDLRATDDRHGQVNLTGIARVEVSADTDLPRLRAALDLARADAPRVLDEVAAAQALPLWILRRLTARAGRTLRQRGRADESFTFSNLGQLDPSAFDLPGFKAEAAFLTPPAHPGAPLFATLSGHAAVVHLCLGAAYGPSGGLPLEALLDRVSAELGDAS